MVAVIILIIYTLYLPNAPFLWLPRQIGEALQKADATHRGDVIMIDYREDSVPYYQGGTIAAAEENFFQTHPPSQWPRWVVISKQAWTRIPAASTAYRIHSRFHGMAYARRGAIMDVFILERIDTQR